MRRRSHCSRWQHAAAQAFRPGVGAVLDRDIESRLVPDRRRDGPRGVAAIGLAPALEQPVWRVT